MRLRLTPNNCILILLYKTNRAVNWLGSFCFDGISMRFAHSVFHKSQKEFVSLQETVGSVRTKKSDIADAMAGFLSNYSTYIFSIILFIPRLRFVILKVSENKKSTPKRVLFLD